MTWARGQSVWAKVTSLPANGVAAGLPVGGGQHPPQSPPQPGLPVGASRAVLCPAVLSRGGGAAEEKEYLHREKIKAGRSPFHLHGFRLIIYPGPSAPGNFAPGHWARTRVRVLPWDAGVEPGRGAVCAVCGGAGVLGSVRRSASRRPGSASPGLPGPDPTRRAAPPAGRPLGNRASCAPLGPPGAPFSRHPRPSRSRTDVPATGECGVDERLGVGAIVGVRGVGREQAWSGPGPAAAQGVEGCGGWVGSDRQSGGWGWLGVLRVRGMPWRSSGGRRVGTGEGPEVGLRRSRWRAGGRCPGGECGR